MRVPILCVLLLVVVVFLCCSFSMLPRALATASAAKVVVFLLLLFYFIQKGIFRNHCFFSYSSLERKSLCALKFFFRSLHLPFESIGSCISFAHCQLAIGSGPLAWHPFHNSFLTKPVFRHTDGFHSGAREFLDISHLASIN